MLKLINVPLNLVATGSIGKPPPSLDALDSEANSLEPVYSWSAMIMRIVLGTTGS